MLIRLPRTTVVALASAWVALAAQAEEKLAGPVAATPTATQAARLIDRDGKPIYGAELMTEQELGGYRLLMHFTKTLEERDALRAEHRKSMERRARERGVTLTD